MPPTPRGPKGQPARPSQSPQQQPLSTPLRGGVVKGNAGSLVVKPGCQHRHRRYRAGEAPSRMPDLTRAMTTPGPKAMTTPGPKGS
eukprot:364963-Chlamydomonas_euryale.AAC.10